MVMEKLGAKIKIEHGYINAECPNGLKGNSIEFPFISVGATANCLMATVLAEGESILKNVAQEPDIDSLIEFLTKMGANIEKINKNDLKVVGVNELKPVTMKMMPDRIEAGTLLIAGAITKNRITVANCEPKHLEALMDKMKLAGCDFKVEGDRITIIPAQKIKPVDITTAPYPEFPTDLQAQFMAYMCLADGVSVITETIYPDRFMHIAELNRLGADIIHKNGSAIVKGVNELSSAEVMATDLRASAALVLAGLAANGKTKISRIYHIDRGYEKIEQKLNNLGADIKRIIT
jgi:UDP-N-acetylglucosamine 1-carboxyvinyltransferase